jgi:hypothetical protein
MQSLYCVFGKTLEGCRRFKPSSHAYIDEIDWMKGALIDEKYVPTPYPGKLHPYAPYPQGVDKQIMPEILSGSMPIMRDDLIAALKEAGVDNLQLFDVTITDPDNGQVYTHYKAVNIVGCIKAADLPKSEYTQHGNGPLIDVDFDKLVIDDKKPRGTLMFRLAESVNVIMLHKSVRDHLLTKNFPFLRFYEPEEVAT